MRIVSVNCSMGKTVSWKGRTIETSIFKDPVTGRVAVGKTNVEGDRQSDLTVHGGPDKAVYSYALEDYLWWQAELNRALTPGAFGENLTTGGLEERNVFIGDVLRAGTAILQVVQPRLPCYKLGIKFGDDQMPKRFMKAARWGIYFRVLEEGTVESGDSIEFVSRDPQQISVPELAILASKDRFNLTLVDRALAIPSLNFEWREMLQANVEKRNR
ncbi:MOSC domain-containing protein [bacterium]|nr:MOSC domain-containing protein [bacterium]